MAKVVKKSLTIAGHEFNLVSIKSEPISFEEKMVDKNGKEVIEIVVDAGKKKETKKTYLDGTPYTESKTYKVCSSGPLKGKIVPKFKATTKIDKYVVIDKADLQFKAIAENVYLVSGKEVKDWIKGFDAEGKCVMFRYTNGNGWKMYKHTVLHLVDTIPEPKVIMTTYAVDLRELNLNEHAEEITVEDDEVEQIDLEAI